MRRADTDRRGESGATLLELLTVMAILGTIANIAIPGSLLALKRARAASVVSDFTTVREAAFRRYADDGEYPSSAPAGLLPPELKGYLDPTFLWVNHQPAFRYKWELWIDEDGEPVWPATGVQVGLSVFADEQNPELFDTIEQIYDGPFVRISRTQALFVIEPVP